MAFNMQWYGGNRRTKEPAFSAIESMTYCFSIFLRIIKIFSNNTNFVGIRFRISLSCFDMKAIISSFFMFMVGVFSWVYSDTLHYPSLPLLSFLWVNLQLTCSQTNPQIQFYSYHHGSPHMIVKVFFLKVKGSFLQTLYCSQHDMLLLVFLSVVFLT